MGILQSSKAFRFGIKYANRSGVTFQWLRKHGREVRPCDCHYEDCEGWQMAHVVDEPKTVWTFINWIFEKMAT